MEDFYSEQAGSGLSPYSGQVRFQKGHGFFGRILKGGIIPLLKKVLPYLGKQALAAGTDLVSELNSGTSLKDSTRKAMKRRMGDIADDALVKIKSKLQEGEGVRRKRRKKAVIKTLKVRKVIKKKKPVKRKPSKRKKKKIAKQFLF